MLRLDDGGDELLVIPLGSSREVSGWWNGWIGRDPDEGVAGWAGKKSRRDKLAAAAEGFGGWDNSPRN